MTSAFYATSPIKLAAHDFSEDLPLFSNHGIETDVGETEDEEVKINCMHGVDRDSDLSFADTSDDDRDGDDDDESVADAGESPGVVHFVTGRVHESEAGIHIVRPRAERLSRLPSHQEEDESESDSGSRESVGARGVGISLGTPTSKMSSDASPSDGDESSISDDEDDDDEENSTVYDEVRFDVESEHATEPSNLVLDASYPSDEDVEYADDLSDLPELLEGQASDEFTPEAMQEKVPNLEDEDGMTTDGVIFLMPQQASVGDSLNGALSYKRCLSSCSFEALFVEVGDNSPKRQKSSELPFMPSLTLGPSALGLNSLQMRQGSSPISTSDDDEEGLDQRLSEELDPEAREHSRENTPVPLLTPPASPLTIEFGGSTVTVCEWPSNLAVDSALTAVSTLRPMSPESLEQLEIDEEQRVGYLGKGAETSTLTPLLRSIYVGIE